MNPDVLTGVLRNISKISKLQIELSLVSDVLLSPNTCELTAVYKGVGDFSQETTWEIIRVEGGFDGGKLKAFQTKLEGMLGNSIQYIPPKIATDQETVFVTFRASSVQDLTQSHTYQIAVKKRGVLGRSVIKNLTGAVKVGQFVDLQIEVLSGFGHVSDTAIFLRNPNLGVLKHVPGSLYLDDGLMLQSNKVRFFPGVAGNITLFAIGLHDYESMSICINVLPA
jgi:hypothetical protein